MSSILRINQITSRTGINTLDFTGNGFSYITDVGFGTTNPTSKLHVEGNILVSGTGIVTATSFVGDGSGLTGVASTDNITTDTVAQFNAGVGIADSIFHIGDDNTAIRFPAADTFTIETAGTEALRVDSSQNLLLGTTTANKRFTVVDRTDAIAAVFGENDNATTEAGIRISARNTANTTGFNLDVEVDADAPAAKFTFAAAERLRITSAGDVGIGTQVPNEGSFGQALTVTTQSSNTIAALELQGDKGSDGAVSVIAAYNYRTGSNNPLGKIEFTRDNGNDTQGGINLFGFSGSTYRGVSIDQNGFVGIRSDNPQEELDVLNDTNGNVTFRVRNINSGTSARSQVSLVSDSATLDCYATSAAYNGVSGWADSGVLSTDSGASGGLKLNAQAGGVTIQTGTNTRLEIQNGGDVLPGADNAQDFGSSSLRWANIYSADLQLSNEGSTNDVDGTWGQYTIQEGENDLFLLNRRNGKTYKFVLEEVN